jgi:Uma2 family endonuclease
MVYWRERLGLSGLAEMVIRDWVEERLYTVDEFWAFIEQPENADRKFELINGVIVEDMSPGLEHGQCTLRIGSPMMIFVDQHDLGTVAVEVDHYMPPDKFNTRRPDVEFISKARLGTFDPTGYVPLMPDLAVEVKSPGNTPGELRQKAAYYLQNGVRLVWLVFPETQTVYVYTPANPAGKKYGIDDTLDGGDVLPGFTLALRDIFRG